MNFAIANVPQRSDIRRPDLTYNTNLYNTLLQQAIPIWQTPTSTVGLVQLREMYISGPEHLSSGTYDGLHPNAIGEYQIAQAFSITLHGIFSLGSGPLVLPPSYPVRPTPIPQDFTVFASPSGLTATWTPVYGAYSYDVSTRIDNITIVWSVGSTSNARYD